ncbi:MAG TPA: potassium channel family protein [Oculatellaceae cyanobacterium]
MTFREILDLVAYRSSKRYYWLLTACVALTALAPLIDHAVIGRFVVGSLGLLALVTASLASNTSRRLAKVAGVLALLNALVWMPALFAYNVPVSPYVQNIAFALTLMFVVNLILIMMQDIYTNEVNGNRVAGAICVYIMIGFAFAIVHMMILNNDANSYKDSSGDSLLQGRTIANLAGQRIYPFFVYYSFCTLSTVGYGDIVPLSRVARTMSWLEAVAGQIYLTVLVARLVGLHIAAGAAASNSLLTSEAQSDGLTVSVGVTNVDDPEEAPTSGAIDAHSPNA